jgi:hypothetical protein
MQSLTLRGCDSELLQILKETSKQQGMSVNRLILQTLRTRFLGDPKKPRRYTDLDDLAGTWSLAEAAAFEKHLAEFDTIDAELWENHEDND